MTSFRLSDEEEAILKSILEMHPFLIQTKTAALRYALYYWAYNPKCPKCGEELEEKGDTTKYWECPHDH